MNLKEASKLIKNLKEKYPQGTSVQQKIYAYVPGKNSDMNVEYRLVWFPAPSDCQDFYSKSWKDIVNKAKELLKEEINELCD
jgi:hypothetical protein